MNMYYSGDTKKPKAWSKYAPDSTAFKKAHPEPEVKKKSKKDKKKEKGDEALELLEKVSFLKLFLLRQRFNEGSLIVLSIRMIRFLMSSCNFMPLSNLKNCKKSHTIILKKKTIMTVLLNQIIKNRGTPIMMKVRIYLIK